MKASEKTINTVLGEKTAKELGIIAPHEHIFINLSAFFDKHPVDDVENPEIEKVTIKRLGTLNLDPYALKDNLFYDDFITQKEELKYFKRAGGGTIVDLTLPGIGRDVNALKQMAEETGLNVIIGTGYYVSSTHKDSVKTQTESEIAEDFVKELTVGIDGTNVKAGIIGEIGISELFNEQERKVLRASAIAHHKTGAPINVHINPWTVNGLESTDILLNAGVAPRAICISHIDVENNEKYIYELLNKGVYIEFDNFGKEYHTRREVRNSGYGLFVSDVERVKLVKKLIADGYAKQILFSCDVCLKSLLRSYGGYGYDHVLRNIIPMLDEELISQADIKQIIEINPIDFLFQRSK
jgi:phosphotriesterase-related protein